MTEPDPCAEVREAVAKKPTEQDERRLIIKKAVDNGCVREIPDDWQFEVGNE